MHSLFQAVTLHHLVKLSATLVYYNRCMIIIKDKLKSTATTKKENIMYKCLLYKWGEITWHTCAHALSTHPHTLSQTHLHTHMQTGC